MRSGPNSTLAITIRTPSCRLAQDSRHVLTSHSAQRPKAKAKSQVPCCVRGEVSFVAQWPLAGFIGSRSLQDAPSAFSDRSWDTMLLPLPETPLSGPSNRQSDATWCDSTTPFPCCSCRHFPFPS